MAALRVGVRTLFIEPGSPWENGYNERFNGTFRDELLNGEIFFTLPEATVLIERWRREATTVDLELILVYRLSHGSAPEITQEAGQVVKERTTQQRGGGSPIRASCMFAGS
jgi:hypothetical protein